MNRLLLIIIFILFAIPCEAQQVTWGNSAMFQRTEWYLPNSPTNNDGNRVVIGWIKGTGMFYMGTDTVKIKVLTGVGNRFVIADPTGRLLHKSYYDVIDTTILSTKYFATLNFQEKGNYLSPSDTVNKWKPINWQPDLSNYYTKIGVDTIIPTKLSNLTNDVGFISTETDPVWVSDSSLFLKKSVAFSTYQLKGNYITPSDTANKWLPNTYLPTWTSITGKPTFFSGSYNDLTDKPTLFSGSYNDLTNKPNIPTKTSDITNDSGFITTEVDPTVSSWAKQPTKPSYSYSEITSKPTNVSFFTNDAGYITSSSLPAYQTLSTVGTDSIKISNGNTVELPSTLSTSKPSRSFNSNFTISTTRNSFVNYSVKISNGTVLVSATRASVFLEYSTNGGSTWIIVSVVEREENGLSLISLATKSSTFVLSGYIPLGSLVRVRTDVLSGSSVELKQVQETLIK